MNVLQIFVTKIHKAERVDTGRGFYVWELIADTNCWGRIERNKKIKASDDDYKHIIEKGYYWG